MAKSSAVQPASSPSIYLWLAAVTSVLTLLVQGYLYLQHLALESGQATKSICDISEKFDCSAVSASQYAVFLNVPVALWGFMASAGYLVLLTVLVFTDDSRKPAARRNLKIAALGIFAGSVVMGSISLFLLSKFCLFCIGAYILSVLLLILTWLGARTLTSFTPHRLGDFKALVITIAVMFVGTFVLNSSMTRGNDVNSPENQAAFSQFVSDWQAAPAKTFTAVDPLVIGPPNAKMVITEFADFRCIHCKHAAPVLHAFVASHPDVRLEFQPWPLDGECNSSLTQVNGASCLLARISWCAQQNKKSGWAVHDYIYGLAEVYASLEAVKADLPGLALASGMGVDELKTCSESDNAKSVVRHQAETGTNLNLEGTPTIYVNGKALSGGQALPVLQKAYRTL